MNLPAAAARRSAAVSSALSGPSVVGNADPIVILICSEVASPSISEYSFLQ